MSFIKITFQLMLFPLPWNFRRKILNKIFHFRIAKSAKMGYSIVLADELIMEHNSHFGHLTFCKNINRIIIKNNSKIGSLNFITGFNQKNLKVFSHRKERKCELIIEEHSAITSRHFLDCNGGIYIGKYSTFAGIRSTILTHSINVYSNRQDALPIHIGNYCFVGTGCILLGGSRLPDFCVLAAGAVLSKGYNEENYLYGGVPAKPLKLLIKDKVLYFNRSVGFVK